MKTYYLKRKLESKAEIKIICLYYIVMDINTGGQHP